MPDKPDVPVDVESILSGLASAQAPVIYFERATFFAVLNGVGKVTLEASRQIMAAAPGGEALFDRVIVAHLVGNIKAIKSLRAGLDAVLLAMEPTPEGPAN
jgi:hypothetical protein